MRRILFFITEERSVLDEGNRAASLKCGMIQDLGVHVIDLMLETLLSVNEWRIRPNDERLQKRVGGNIEIKNCVKSKEMHSSLGDDVETFAAIDFHITEQIEFPSTSKNTHHFQHEFDILIVLGKGLAIEQDVPE